MNDLDVGLARSVPVTLPSVKSLESVAADPISEMRSLGSSLLRSVTGGKLRRNLSGAAIKALRSLNVFMNHGERITLIGHNGAGKSTFLRLISGIYQTSSGFLHIHTFAYLMIHRSFIASYELSELQAIKAHHLIMHGNLQGFEEFLEDVREFSGLGDCNHLSAREYSQGMAARPLFSVLKDVSRECLALDEGIGTGGGRRQKHLTSLSSCSTRHSSPVFLGLDSKLSTSMPKWF